jgi:tetratricopeptide (TPR) repeat protein
MTKLRFEELEKRCSRLKKVRILRFVSIIATFFLGGFGGYYWVHQSKSEPVVEPMHPKEPVTVTLPSLNDRNESNATLVETAVAPEVLPNETLFLAPHVYKEEVKLLASETAEATRSLNEEQQLLKTYNAAQTFDNAYDLAHFYLERKAYAEAIMWSKEASKYNASSEKPWLLYAKAKFYLGDRTEAIRSLELFLSYINSTEVQELLNFYKGQE